MARARNIKPAFFLNDELSALPFEARLLFIGLWTIADRRGRLEDRPKRIKAAVFPYDPVDVDVLLQSLQDTSERFITRYDVNGVRYIQVTNFERHQSPHKNEVESTIPAPCLHGTNTVQIPEKHDSNRAESVSPLLNPDFLNDDSLKPHTPTPASGGMLMPSAQERRFNEFWAGYPQKVAKKTARKAWGKIQPDETLHRSIMTGVEKAKRSDKWRRENGRYIPNPATWLNGGCWEDELTEAGGAEYGEHSANNGQDSSPTKPRGFNPDGFKGMHVVGDVKPEPSGIPEQPRPE